ncbi:unnamed protein product [Symbiodinium sp. KB8]|nr:unnamed protein product [Symbiodinium sp. KB8]
MIAALDKAGVSHDLDERLKSMQPEYTVTSEKEAAGTTGSGTGAPAQAQGAAAEAEPAGDAGPTEAAASSGSSQPTDTSSAPVDMCEEVAWDEPPSTAEVEEMAKHLGLNLPAEADLLWIALEGELALVNR